MKEILQKQEEYEKLGLLNEHITPVDEKEIIFVDENFPYYKKPIGLRIRQALARFFIVNFFVRYQNGRKHLKIVGKKNLKGIKNGIVTCNHIEIFDFSGVRKAIGANRIYYTGAPFNNRNTFFGEMMRAEGMLPISTTHAGMRQFNEAIEHYLVKKHKFILFYPEQAMWWFYEKPRPFKNGAFHYAAKYNLPVVPLFYTFENRKKISKDGTMRKKFILHVMKPIYPNKDLTQRENVDYLRDKNYELCQKKYEEFYHQPLQYTTDSKENTNYFKRLYNFLVSPIVKKGSKKEKALKTNIQND